MLGRHRGIWNYTIGQRKGLGISFSQPMYVCRIDSASNAVILSDNARLFSDSLTVGELNWLSIPGPWLSPWKCRLKSGTATLHPLLSSILRSADRCGWSFKRLSGPSHRDRPQFSTTATFF